MKITIWSVSGMVDDWKVEKIEKALPSWRGESWWQKGTLKGGIVFSLCSF